MWWCASLLPSALDTPIIVNERPKKRHTAAATESLDHLLGLPNCAAAAKPLLVYQFVLPNFLNFQFYANSFSAIRDFNFTIYFLFPLHFRNTRVACVQQAKCCANTQSNYLCIKWFSHLHVQPSVPIRLFIQFRFSRGINFKCEQFAIEFWSFRSVTDNQIRML